MFQTKIDKTEEDFKELTYLFRSEIYDEYKYAKPDDREWDLNERYFPDWTCIWNKPGMVTKECEILIKDSVMALVLFEGEKRLKPEDISWHMYRLEDLCKISYDEEPA